MKRALIILLAVAFLVPLARAQEQETRYVNNSFARISHLTGTAFIQKAQDLGSEDAELNAPIAEGDRIGTTDGRVEIYLGKRQYIRMDQNSKVDFVSLPRRDNGITRIRQWAGHMYLEVGALTKEKSIEILTDDATFYVLDKGLYRIDVREGGDTELLVFQGMIEAAGEDGSMLVKDAQKIVLANGIFQGKPAAFFAAAVEDEFDRFNSARLTAVNRQAGRGYLPEELSDLEFELDEYGDWNESSEFGYVWVPRNLGPDWRPYSNGHWTWVPMAGWCWVPFESWGWGPFHYGRWHWDTGWGWYWIPMSVWGPAWVDWWWGYDCWGWAPLSYWGYPGILFNNRYYGREWHGEYPRNSRAMTVVRKDQFLLRDMRKAALGPDALRNAGQITMSGKMPDVRPVSVGRISTEPLKNGGVILRRGGASTAGDGLVRSQGDRVRGTDTAPKNDQAAGSRVNDGRTGGAATQGGNPPANKPGESGTVNRGGNAQGTPPPGAAGASGERKKRDGESDSSYETRSYSPGSGYGYPSSPAITRDSAGSGRSTSGSVLGDIYRRIRNGNSGSTVNRNSSSNSDRSSSRATTPRSSSSSGSSAGGSSSRGSSSSGSSRSSGGGSRSSGGGGSSRPSGGGGGHRR
ncbi:MAG: FecR domain-containing protein [Acidobacteriota bacterium]|nr:FecR domain-containing protein [Acidobacteriota bacterium]